mmetsp:Transcript_10219/g.29122  ORF Transcript_10219/g.29122 Transcript_10219/m.29122 type:complete len:82 (+) Transcript_10219:155-400(+)
MGRHYHHHQNHNHAPAEWRTAQLVGLFQRDMRIMDGVNGTSCCAGTTTTSTTAGATGNRNEESHIIVPIPSFLKLRSQHRR